MFKLAFRRRAGFTFVELIVCATLIFLLTGLLLPNLLRTRESAWQTQCASNLKQIGMALHLYAQDHNGRFPPTDHDWAPLSEYSQNVGILRCTVDPRMKAQPLSSEDAEVAADTPSSYLYRGGLTNDARARTLIARDEGTWHRGHVNVLDVGGGVRSVIGAEAQRLWSAADSVVSRTPKP